MTDLNEEMQQGRALIERWVSADQTFRDVSFTCTYYTTHEDPRVLLSLPLVFNSIFVDHLLSGFILVLPRSSASTRIANGLSAKSPKQGA